MTNISNRTNWIRPGSHAHDLQHAGLAEHLLPDGQAPGHFSTPYPPTREAWEKEKRPLRGILWRLLGDLPPLFVPSAAATRKRVPRPLLRSGYSLETFAFDNGAGATVYGHLLLPLHVAEPRPAILYHHYCGGRFASGKDEVLSQAYADWGGGPTIPGEDLVREGYVVACIDAYAYGQRQSQGPAGPREVGARTQESLVKACLWQGRTLWGMMVRDDLLALNYLLARPEVDPRRVAAIGFSMGGTRSCWAAALDDRIHATVSVACLTRCRDLLAAGNLDCHGMYYYLPGILRERIDTEAIVGLIAPRPHLAINGACDPATPPSGIQTICRVAEHLYGLYGCPECFLGRLHAGAGHIYSDAMWRETLQFLARHLDSSCG